MWLHLEPVYDPFIWSEWCIGGLVLRPVGCGMCVFSDPPKPWPRSKPTLAFLTAHRPRCVYVHVCLCTHVTSKDKGLQRGENTPDTPLLPFLSHTQNSTTHTHTHSPNVCKQWHDRRKQTKSSSVHRPCRRWPVNLTFRHLHSLGILSVSPVRCHTHSQKNSYTQMLGPGSWQHLEIPHCVEYDLHSRVKYLVSTLSRSFIWHG